MAPARADHSANDRRAEAQWALEASPEGPITTLGYGALPIRTSECFQRIPYGCPFTLTWGSEQPTLLALCGRHCLSPVQLRDSCSVQRLFPGMTAYGSMLLVDPRADQEQGPETFVISTGFR